MRTRTAGAPCQMNLLATLAQARNLAFPARRDTSCLLRTSCGDLAVVTIAIEKLGLSDFFRWVLPGWTTREDGKLQT